MVAEFLVCFAMACGNLLSCFLYFCFVITSTLYCLFTLSYAVDMSHIMLNFPCMIVFYNAVLCKCCAVFSLLY